MSGSWRTPLGSIQDPDATIYPVKHHTAVQPFDRSTNAISPLKLRMLFQTGDPDAASRAGATALGGPLDQGDDFIGTERFMGIYHEVGPAEDGLGCHECHRPNVNRLWRTRAAHMESDPLRKSLLSRMTFRSTGTPWAAVARASSSASTINSGSSKRKPAPPKPSTTLW